MIFRKDGKTSLNACVGSNGIQIDIRLAEGYAAVPEILIKHIAKSNTHEVDTLVFPIIYSARHSIELYIKDALRILNTLRGTEEIDLTKLEQTHSFICLTSYLDSISSKTDRRIRRLISLVKDGLLDFSRIDDHGQTFRYAKDVDQNLNLKDQHIISLDLFYLEYKEFIKKIQRLAWTARDITEEYRLGTFTKDFSRRDLECMSRILPKYENWSQGTAFDDVFDRIIKRTGIARRRLSCAINIIKSHKEFAGNIGINNESGLNDSALIAEIFDKHNAYFTKYPPEYGVATSLFSDPGGLIDAFKSTEYSNELALQLESKLDEPQIQYISAIVDLGRRENYCEHFDLILSEHTNSHRKNKSELIEELITNPNLYIYVFSGLKKNGKIKIQHELNSFPITSVPHQLAEEFTKGQT